jgi:hypothetical protein
MRFESRRGQNDQKMKKTTFCNLKKHIFFTPLFGWSFGFAFQRSFVELEKVFL